MLVKFVIQLTSLRKRVENDRTVEFWQDISITLNYLDIGDTFTCLNSTVRIVIEEIT